jgi:CO/xanthine dehydrogenase Mo-binding subunit
MFLEPESGLAWYDAGRKTLELVVGVQSPYDAAESVAFLLGEADAAHKPARINTHFAYMGGGFGGTGKIFAFAADHVLHAGGLANFSPHVASVGAVAALGIYYVPKVDITTVSLPSRAVTAGSMRGYGTLQAMTALEVLVDEMCTALPLDPIEFRRRNAIKPGERTLTGNTYNDSIRAPEILDKLERHAIWRERAAEKARGKEAGILVGTGVACAHKNYGTGADCSLGAVEIDPQGRIAIRVDDTEIDNGLGTAVANRVAAHLGGVADEVALAQIDAFGPLAGQVRRSLHDRSEDAGRRGAQSALGPGNLLGNRRLDRRPCRDARRGRSRAGNFPLRFMAGGARIMAHRPEGFARAVMADSALEGRTVDRARSLPTRALRCRGARACKKRHHRRNGPWF